MMYLIAWIIALISIEAIPNVNAWFLEYPDNYFTFGHNDPGSCNTLVDKVDSDG
jgi:hypothetical protein